MRERLSCRLAADIGGTFTDIALEFGQTRITAKVLTTPLTPEMGVVEGIREALGRGGLAPADLDVFVHGTTLATNALIERRGAITALITTEGFRDVIEIGRESRFDQYDINLAKPSPLVPRTLRYPVIERIVADGSVLTPLDMDGLAQHAAAMRSAGVESIAVGLLHSYANPTHERAIAARLRDLMPNAYVSLSSEVCPEIREFERITTTCANAYVQPVISGYLRRLRDALAGLGFHCPIMLMTSGGGITTLENACQLPIRLVESGPAGGAILAAQVGRQCGWDELVSFDMGGTTAKICLIDQFEPLKSRVFEVARSKRFMKGSGMPVRIPVIEMVEIGAGGGSIAKVDSLGRIQVGPESASSEPGPACYGRGGKSATVTDADLLLGKLDPTRFAGGSIALLSDRSNLAIEQQVGQVLKVDATVSAVGICEVVEENMASATRVHAVERGKDLRTRTMIAFGGAAPLHAARLAEKLDIARVVVPRSAGVGSAVGFLRAPVSYEVVRSLFTRFSALDPTTINALFSTMIAEARDVVLQTVPESELRVRRSAFLRYAGQGHEIEIPLPDRPLETSDGTRICETFHERYSELYGRMIDRAEVEALSWAVVVGDKGQAHGDIPYIAPASAESISPVGETSLFDAKAGEFLASPVYWRDHLRPGFRVTGPAIVAEDETSTVVTSSFEASVNTSGHLVLNARKRT